jgi:hypothetical protein
VRFVGQHDAPTGSRLGTPGSRRVRSLRARGPRGRGSRGADHQPVARSRAAPRCCSRAGMRIPVEIDFPVERSEGMVKASEGTKAHGRNEHTGSATARDATDSSAEQGLEGNRQLGVTSGTSSWRTGWQLRSHLRVLLGGARGAPCRDVALGPQPARCPSVSGKWRPARQARASLPGRDPPTERCWPHRAWVGRKAKGATAVVTRYGCRRGELFEGFSHGSEGRLGQALRRRVG